MRINVFGKIIEAKPGRGGWQVFYLGADGKKRLAHDLVIPASVKETELIGYLDDLCHELANERNSRVEIID